MSGVSVWRAGLLLAFLAAGCRRDTDHGGSAPAGHVSGSGDATAAPVLLLRLERGACMGRCPEYAVTLFADGAVQYAGIRNVHEVGVRERRVDAMAVRGLHAALLAAGVADADSLYGIDNPTCRQYLPDTPVSILSVRIDGTVRRIQREPGCTGAPAYLAAFEARIDSLAGTAVWVLGPTERSP